MTVLLSHFWLWILGALLVGLATGLLTRESEPGGGISPWLSAAIGGLAFGALAAMLRVLPERAGVWLESALVMGLAFLVGSALGAIFRGGALREHKHWFLGVIPLGLLWISGTIIAGAALETALVAGVGEAMKLSGTEASIDVRGRDVTLAKDAANRDAQVGEIKKVAGVRLVKEAAEAVANKAADAAGKLEQGAEKTEGAIKAEAESAEKTAGAAQQDAAMADQAVVETAKEAAAVKSAVESVGDKAAEAKAKLAALPAAGELDKAACESALNATVTVEKIQFSSGRADVATQSEGLLQRLADLLKRCPDTRAEIAGHTDNRGREAANRKLSQRRAAAVADYLKKDGVKGGRLTAIGYGWDKPVASNDTEEGRAENRRIEFTLK